MPGSEVDFVSDLNSTGDNTVSVHESESTEGGDAVQIDKLSATREPVTQPKKVGDAADGDNSEKPLSLRDQISSALKGEPETPAAASQDGVVRDPATGKFVAKAEEAVEGAPVAAVPVGIDEQVFKSLPAETQAQLARTMDGIAQSQQRFAQLEPIEQLIAPRVQAWAMNGVAPAQALGQLFALSDFATQDIQGFIKHIAHANGVDLEELVLGIDPAEQVDPNTQALLNRIAALEGQNTRSQQQQQQAAHTETVNSVSAFALEKGQDGKPLRPYFNELGADVLPFISAVKSQNPTWNHSQVLQEAYDRACWGTPSVRGKMQAATQAVAEAERLRAGNERAEKARTASASVKSGAPTSAPAAPNDSSRSLRDTIKASIAASD